MPGGFTYVSHLFDQMCHGENSSVAMQGERLQAVIAAVLANQAAIDLIADFAAGQCS